MKLVTVSQASAMDRTAIEEYAIPGIILMENAANAACRIIREKTLIEENNFLLLCGSGNNGGDGLALARLLYSEGGAPLVMLKTRAENLSGSALENYNILKNYPIEIVQNYTKERLKKELSETDIIIDALLGTGLNREIYGDLKSFIDIINDSDKHVFSIDIPTGINGDTGRIMGTAVQASDTISFGALKPGNLLYPGFSFNGDLHLSRISFPPEIYDSELFTLELNICRPLPPRNVMGHKKTFGDTLVISGAGSYYGAPFFAASAVLKSGGGFCRLAVPGSLVPVLASKLSEAVYLPQDETSEKSLALSNLSPLLEEAKKSDALIIGPGLSLNDETSLLITDLIKAYDGFMIIDGDAISAVSGNCELLAGKPVIPVITPHMGEMSRLCGKTVREITADPLKAIRECAQRYNAIIVLKGAHSQIGLPDGRVFINTTGNSGMGTAGSGDILTGIIGAFYGLGLNETDAVKSAVFIHGTAGDMASDKMGKDGMTASDILGFLTPAVREYRESYSQLIKNYQKIINEI